MKKEIPKKSQLHSCKEADHLCDGAPGHVGQPYILRMWITCGGAAFHIPMWQGWDNAIWYLGIAPLSLFY